MDTVIMENTYIGDCDTKTEDFLGNDKLTYRTSLTVWNKKSAFKK